jgi:hypothetical protein
MDLKHENQIITQICANLDCNLAGIEQDFSNFHFRKDSKSYRKQCKICCNKQSNNFYKKNRNDLLIKAKEYVIKNKEIVRARRKIFTNANKLNKKEYDKIYYQKNKNKIVKATTQYKNNKRKEDLCIRLKGNVSHLIRQSLKAKNYSKNKKSVLKYLPYSIQELKTHIESQFESWMTWDNYGKYFIDTWNDNDQSTWTWQIDHIIPHSTFEYTSMEDNTFLKCWSLDNLRPLSAKQNLLDGNRRS